MATNVLSMGGTSMYQFLDSVEEFDSLTGVVVIDGEVKDNPLQHIDELNLGCVKEKLQTQHGWTVERCELAEKDYRKFLKLAVLERGQEISPLGDIDEMWHTHILFTKKYHRDCQKIFGRYMHHNPLFSDKDAERLANGRASTRLLFLKHFGECTELVDSCGCGNSGGNCCGNDS